jgi:pentapeptide repeat protein
MARHARGPDQHSRLAIVLVGFGVLVFLAAYFLLPLALVHPRTVDATGLRPKELVDAQLRAQADEDKGRNDVRTSAIQGLGGLAVVIGSYLTLRTLKLSRDVHVTDTFSTAITNLQAQDLVGRRGGIHALERVARMSRYDHSAVVDVLTEFVRAHAPKGKSRSAVETASVQAAMTTLGRLDRDRDPAGHRLDLTNTDLSDLVLNNAQLQRANFTNAELRRAQLFDAHLEGADFRRADLRGAALAGARCAGANFELAHLEGADTDQADSLDSGPAHCGGVRGAH